MQMQSDVLPLSTCLPCGQVQANRRLGRIPRVLCYKHSTDINDRSRRQNRRWLIRRRSRLPVVPGYGRQRGHLQAVPPTVRRCGEARMGGDAERRRAQDRDDSEAAPRSLVRKAAPRHHQGQSRVAAQLQTHELRARQVPP